MYATARDNGGSRGGGCVRPHSMPTMQVRTMRASHEKYAPTYLRLRSLMDKASVF